MANSYKFIVGVATLFGIGAGSAQADDRQLKEALRRLEALESRTSVLEKENNLLRTKLSKPNDNISGSSKRFVANQNTKTIPNQIQNSSRFTQEITTPSLLAEEYISTNNRLWQGVYMGINAGYGSGSYTTTNQTYTISSSDYSMSDLTNYNFSEGPVAGAQIGYNYQYENNFVLGAEIDIDWTDVINHQRYTQSANASIFASNEIGTSSYYLNNGNSFSREGMDWIGTARARIGYAIDRFVPYITGGLAFGQLSYNAKNYGLGTFMYSNDSSNLSSGSYGMDFSQSSKTTTGWALGAGAEYMVANNWSVKAEYLYTSIGGVNSHSLPINSSFTTDSGVTSSQVIGNSWYVNTLNAFGVHQARIGLNYHLN